MKTAVLTSRPFHGIVLQFMPNHVHDGPPSRQGLRRKAPRRGPVSESESIETQKERATNTRHSARHYATSVTLRQSKLLRTPRNCVSSAGDSRTATSLVSLASRASTTQQKPAGAAASEPTAGRVGRACRERLLQVGKQLAPLAALDASAGGLRLCLDDECTACTSAC